MFLLTISLNYLILDLNWKIHRPTGQTHHRPTGRAWGSVMAVTMLRA